MGGTIKSIRKKFEPFLMIFPTTLIFILFFVIPLMGLFMVSLYTYIPGYSGQMDPSRKTLENYLYFLDSPQYLNYLVITLRMPAIATLFAVLLGYPLAYTVVRARSSRIKKILLAALIVLFFSNTVTRLYSVILLIGEFGVVNSILEFFSLPRVTLMGTQTGVIIGMSHWLIPVAALSLIGSLNNINPSLEEAAKSLGASGLQTFIKVTLPLSIPGIIAATLLCYTLGAAMFVTPMLLGQGKVYMLSNLIWHRLIEVINFPGAGAIAFILLTTVLIITYGVNRTLTRFIKVK